jgi:DNA invertase Pin-like site-specific DNA recombinase
MTTALRLSPVRWLLKAGTRCLCLGRVSTTQQAGPEKISLRQQADTTRAFALTLGVGRDRVEVREDPGVSGLDADRLEEIVAACERSPRPASQPGYVVVYDLSRFTRLGSEAAFYYLHRLRVAGWQFRDTTLKLTGNEMSDAVQLVVAAEVAAEHSRMLKRKVPPGMRAAALKGLWLGRAPHGYAIGPDRKLVPGAAEDVARVRRVFERFAEGATLAAIGDEVGWLPTSVRCVVKNPAYVGTLAWSGRRRSSLDEPPAPVRIEHAHPALIDRRTWEAAQRRLANVRPKRPDADYLLSGLLVCPSGHAYSGGGGIPASVKPSDREALRFYRVKHRDACDGTVNKAWIERTVLTLVATYVDDLLRTGTLRRAIDRLLADPRPTRSAKDLERRRRDLLARKRRLIALAETTDDADVAARLAQLTKDLAQLDREAKQPRDDGRAVRRRELLDWAKDAQELTLANASLAQQRAVLQEWVESVVVDAKRGRLIVTARRVPRAAADTRDSLVCRAT